MVDDEVARQEAERLALETDGVAAVIHELQVVEARQVALFL